MKFWVTMLVVIGCVPPSTEPDAGSDTGTIAPDALDVLDAGVPDTPDAPCITRLVQCGDTIIELCIPPQGCATYTCDGQNYGYCL